MTLRRAVGALACVLAGCTTAPPQSAWLQPEALRSCLALRIPPELLRNEAAERITISMELSVLPSGRIESASVLSDPDNAALDTYLAEHLVALSCAPFTPVPALSAYPVSLQLQVNVRK